MSAKVSQPLLEQLLTNMHTMEESSDVQCLLGSYDMCRTCTQQLLENGTLSKPAFKMLAEILAMHYQTALNAVVCSGSAGPVGQ